MGIPARFPAPPAAGADNAGMPGYVSTVVIEVARGADSKLYPARPLMHEQRNRARWLAHNLVHRDGLSVRQAQRVMAAQHGIRRSVGTIARNLVLFACPQCEYRGQAWQSWPG